MDHLIEKFRKKLMPISLRFQRSLMDEIAWKERLIGIKGARGAGKTTMLLQRIKAHHLHELDQVLYVSLDDIWFAEHRLVDLVDEFVKTGGRYLFLDEVHKYPDWSREVKNIYDDYPELQIVFTGSSLLEILNARADLSRRSIHYELQGLSFREYLHFAHGKKFEAVSLTNLLAHSYSISVEVTQSIRPLAFFKDYLKSAYYPYAQESRDSYHERLASVVNLILELELPQLRQVDIAYVPKLKKLLLVIAESAPFTPNVSALSRKIGVNRETIMTYLYHLASAGLTRHLFKTGKGITRLQKPDKIFLDNTNLAYAIRPHGPDMGMLRETFFASQVGYQHQLSYPEKGDFMVDDQWTFEIGGKNKNRSQIKNVPHSFAALDGIEIGHSQKIPLWLFGFLY